MAFCRYVLRRAKQDFRQHRDDIDDAAVAELVKEAKHFLEVVKRQAVVYSMYARKHKSIMVRCPRTAFHHQKL